MKTLIFNGSPRRNGNTKSLIDLLCSRLQGEHTIVDAYFEDIAPCTDCRVCRRRSGCVIDDRMQEIYEHIQECDNILIASPIYFSELPGRLLCVGSRLQTYFCQRYFGNEEPIPKAKKGAVILVGGGDGDIRKACDTAHTLLRHMNCCEIHEAVCFRNTNEQAAIDDPKTREGVFSIAEYFNTARGYYLTRRRC